MAGPRWEYSRNSISSVYFLASIIMTTATVTGCFEDTITETRAIFVKEVKQYNCSPFIATFTGLACCDQKIAH
jgi:hypothetical protein